MNNSKQTLGILMMVALSSVMVVGTGLAPIQSFADKDKYKVSEIDDPRDNIERILIEEIGTGNDYEINTDAELCETEQCLIEAGI
jgi:hypothetical protein